ncbi:unnamed protein product [Sphenostylis stenocarpa]|uniref:Uncharacterized protein n=1 Tax=Sphenostylis stenocarpa TaxID=92480 RepID=A0AA86SUI1_9FABA|nr:unnamed protein product [Sphenostylis stenocarpa]
MLRRGSRERKSREKEEELCVSGRDRRLDNPDRRRSRDRRLDNPDGGLVPGVRRDGGLVLPDGSLVPSGRETLIFGPEKPPILVRGPNSLS